MGENGTTYISSKDDTKLYKKMRSVHECTDMVVVEDVVERSDIFGNDNEWKEERIFGTDNLEEMNSFHVDVGTEDDWEDRDFFIHLHSIMMKMKIEQIDVDGELWNDDGNRYSEESSNVGDGRRSKVVKILKPKWPSAIIRVQ
eukprot:1106708-Ditylum_brightwellii.AAC.1